MRTTTTSATLAALSAVLLCACAVPRPPVRTDVPEPAVSPVSTLAPAGRLVALTGGAEPEGLVADDVSNTLAIAVRKPDGVLLADLRTGVVRTRVPTDGAPRHLQLEGPGGPLLAPAEGGDRLYRLALPGGAVIDQTAVGRQPHDAAAAGGSVFVGDELGNTVHVIHPDGSVAVQAAPLQPGGVAAARDGSVVLVVGVRGRQVQALRADGAVLGRAPGGVGPTHVRAGPGGLFYVADTEGNAVLVFGVGPRGPRLVGRVATGGTPYGVAVDAVRRRVYVTLTASNTLRSFRIDGHRLVPDRTWPTPRQPNDVAVDEKTGQVVVAGTAGSVLQYLDP